MSPRWRGCPACPRISRNRMPRCATGRTVIRASTLREGLLPSPVCAGAGQENPSPASRPAGATLRVRALVPPVRRMPARRPCRRDRDGRRNCESLREGRGSRCKTSRRVRGGARVPCGIAGPAFESRANCGRSRRRIRAGDQRGQGQDYPASGPVVNRFASVHGQANSVNSPATNGLFRRASTGFLGFHPESRAARRVVRSSPLLGGQDCRGPGDPAAARRWRSWSIH